MHDLMQTQLLQNLSAMVHVSMLGVSKYISILTAKCISLSNTSMKAFHQPICPADVFNHELNQFLRITDTVIHIVS